MAVIPLRRGQLAEPALGRPGLTGRAVIARAGTEPGTPLASLGRQLGPGRSLAARIGDGFLRPLSAGHRPVARRRCGGGQVLRRSLGSRCLGSRGQWRRELGRGKGLRLSRGLGLSLRLSMGRAQSGDLSLRLRLRCRSRSLRHGLGTSGSLGLRGSLGLLRR
jgi:hypothetical protein